MGERIAEFLSAVVGRRVICTGFSKIFECFDHCLMLFKLESLELGCNFSIHICSTDLCSSDTTVLILTVRAPVPVCLRARTWDFSYLHCLLMICSKFST